MKIGDKVIVKENLKLGEFVISKSETGTVSYNINSLVKCWEGQVLTIKNFEKYYTTLTGVNCFYVEENDILWIENLVTHCNSIKYYLNRRESDGV